MIIDGERIKQLVSGAKSDVILCAPFLKAKVVAIILDAIPSAVPVRIVTRWRPAEVAAGISDLEVYDIAKERPHTEVRLVESLHAKLYVADDDCLVGSANLTAAALGWCKEPNLEILLATQRSNPEVVRLLERLATATRATFQIRSEIEKQAADLETVVLKEAQEVGADAAGRCNMPWLPRCAAPDKLFAVYQNRETTAVVAGTRSDAFDDLADLLPPPGLNRETFTEYVSSALYQLPSFQQILDSIPGRLTDAQGVAKIGDLRPDFSQADSQKQWHIVREWIGEFFVDRFEVAPESYVVRLKPH